VSNFTAHHNPSEKSKDEWLTDPGIIKACGPFDLDPCAPIVRPWDTAAKHFTIEDDGLSRDWSPYEMVWMNPPYNDHIGDWFEKLADHGNGIALVFARTETAYWHNFIWPKASGVFFFRGRITFHHVTGQRAKFTGGAPSVLIAYGFEAEKRLRNLTIPGHFIQLRNP
jgi:hypothetical protein